MIRCLGFFDASLCFPKKRRVSIPGGLVSRHQRGHYDHSLNFNYDNLSNIKNVIIGLSISLWIISSEHLNLFCDLMFLRQKLNSASHPQSWTKLVGKMVIPSFVCVIKDNFSILAPLPLIQCWLRNRQRLARYFSPHYQHWYAVEWGQIESACARIFTPEFCFNFLLSNIYRYFFHRSWPLTKERTRRRQRV